MRNISQYILTSFKKTVELNKGSVLYPISTEERKKVLSSASRSAGLSNFACQAQRESHSGTVISASLGTVEIANKRRQRFSVSLSKCTVISSTDPDIFFKKGT